MESKSVPLEVNPIAVFSIRLLFLEMLAKIDREKFHNFIRSRSDNCYAALLLSETIYVFAV
ncbi:MAG: hypothetical protein ACRC62_16320 [Microcoleus sp.]